MLKTECFDPRSRTKQECLLLPLIFITVSEVLDSVIRQENEIKATQIGKKEMIHQFTLNFYVSMQP